MTDLPLGSESRLLRVAVVGSGPSAFYATEALFKTENLAVRVDMFDRLPTPYGLVRGGVAPDHQKIKNVARVYEKIAADPRFRFFGNVTVGRDLTVEELEARYDRIVWGIGNEGDRKLGIEGEELQGVTSATEFVGWYNAHPDYRDSEFPLSTATRAVVVGNGNVAMDVARVLLRDPDELAPTDIGEEALAKLRQSRIREVVLLGRRGAAQAAFSPTEIKELSECEGVDLVVDPAEVALDPVSAKWLEEGAPRSAKKNFDFLSAQAEKDNRGAERKVSSIFCASPVEVLGEDGKVRGLKVQRNELYASDDGTPRPKGKDEFFELDCQFVLRAVGYRGLPIPGMPFDDWSGIIPNSEGRVILGEGGEQKPGHYVVGWAKRGPTGLIGNNSPDSKATIASLIADLDGATAAALPEGEDGAMGALLRERDIDFVSYADWQAMNAWELAEGEKLGKVRRKLADVDAIMAVVRELRAAD